MDDLFIWIVRFGAVIAIAIWHARNDPTPEERKAFLARDQ